MQNLKRSKRNEFIRFMNVLTSIMRSLDESQFEALLSGHADLVFTENNRKKDLLKDTKREEFYLRDYQDLRYALMLAESIDAAEKLISGRDFTRSFWEGFAKYVSVSVSKRDSIEKIKNKIISAIVGARLNSAAIRGDNNI